MLPIMGPALAIEGVAGIRREGVSAWDRPEYYPGQIVQVDGCMPELMFRVVSLHGVVATLEGVSSGSEYRGVDVRLIRPLD